MNEPAIKLDKLGTSFQQFSVNEDLAQNMIHAKKGLLKTLQQALHFNLLGRMRGSLSRPLGQFFRLDLHSSLQEDASQ